MVKAIVKHVYCHMLDFFTTNNNVKLLSIFRYGDNNSNT